MNTLPRGLENLQRPRLRRATAGVTGVAQPLFVCHYRVLFNSSWINWSAVVITRLAAEKPVDEIIMLMNSFDRSTLLASSDPARIAPAVSSSGPVIFGTPLLAPVLYRLPPLSTNPVGLSNV